MEISSDPREIKEQAEQLVREGRYRQALELYQKIRDQEPENARWSLKEGEMLRRVGRTADAIRAFRRACATYAGQGFLLKAIAMCHLILRLDPGHSETQEELARLHARRHGGRGPTRDDLMQVRREVAATADGDKRETLRLPAVDGPPSLAQEPFFSRPFRETPPGADLGELPLAVLPPARAAYKPARKRKTIPPGTGLDALDLGQVVPEAQARDAAGTPAAGRLYEIPLEEEPASAEEAVEPGPLPRVPPTPLFSSLDPVSLQQLIEKVTVRQFGPDERIITRGEQGENLYVVVEGEVAVLLPGEEQKEVARLGEGDFFGEIALLANRERTHTVQAATATTVLEISRDTVGDLVEDHPAVLKVLLRFFRSRLINDLLRTSELFAPFSAEQREHLASRFAFLEAGPGTPLVKRGRPADGLYILLTGRLQVLQDGEEAGEELEPGDLFGAASMVSGEPVQLTVQALSKSWLLKLDRATFREVIMTHPQFLAAVSELVSGSQGAGPAGAELRLRLV